MTVANGFSAGLVPMIIIGNVRWLDVPKGDECIPTLCGATFSNKCFNSASRTDTKTLLSHTTIHAFILRSLLSFFLLFCFALCSCNTVISWLFHGCSLLILGLVKLTGDSKLNVSLNKCLALCWHTADLSWVCPSSPFMTTGTGSLNPKPHKWLRH